MASRSQPYYAHSLEGHPPKDWQPLEEHLRNVAEMAADFARPFGGEEWAGLLGECHDVGKGTLPWQAYLRHANGIADEFAQYYQGHPTHALSGAQHLSECAPQAGKLLAYCCAGHHGGLPNWHDCGDAALQARLSKALTKLAIPLPSVELPHALPLAVQDGDRFGFQLQFFVRMLFSCLVDADYLDTEATMDKNRTNSRPLSLPLKVLARRFWAEFNHLRENADPAAAKVNEQREAVLRDCLKKAIKQPGFFSLTVPTGGGKTLASLAFALEHAAKHPRMRRIIYVIPFTSIIEQNAKVFRDVLGDDAVLEHHCNFVPDDTDWQTRLASENWDAPVVVTTNVQFFNSFYANKSSRSRKLHNVTNSIVIFDEVQAIPIEKLKPCIEVIKELSLNYGVTSVLCTATQPALEYTDSFECGLRGVVEIVSDVPTLFSALKRTEEVFVGELTTQDVADCLADQEQVLCIVNTRQQALDIFEALPDSEANIHLSALMYPSHRTGVLEEVRRRLKDELPCRVVSTQLIEAGVDVDFPCVYRAATGIDSIAQAAGRCNRNGLSDTPRRVFVFQFPEEFRCGFFKQAAQSAAKLFDRFTGKMTAPECVREYFADFFWKNEQRMDAAGILAICTRAQRGDIQFKDIAEFQMIESATIPIVVALEQSAVQLVRSLAFAPRKGRILRKLQQYTVQVYSYQFDDLRNWLECPEPGVWVMSAEMLYCRKTGLKCKPPEGHAFFG